MLHQNEDQTFEFLKLNQGIKFAENGSNRQHKVLGGLHNNKYKLELMCLAIYSLGPLFCGLNNIKHRQNVRIVIHNRSKSR